MGGSMGGSTAGSMIELPAISYQPLCADALHLSCQSGTIRLNTANGQALYDHYDQCNEDSSFAFPGKELFFEFQSDISTNVSFIAKQINPSFAVTYRFLAFRGRKNGICGIDFPCVGQTEEIIGGRLDLAYDQNDVLFLSYDPRVFEETTEIELQVICEEKICGNGILTANESCDDGNTNNGDGCNQQCEIEVGFSCEGIPSICQQSICGNGMVEEGAEQCDDGNQSSMDGCSATCQVENGYVCDGMPSTCSQSAGERCEDAYRLGEGLFNGANRGFSDDYQGYFGACGNGITLDAPDRVFVVTVPARSILNARLTENLEMSARGDLKLLLSQNCDFFSAQCEQIGDELYWHNPLNQAVDIYLMLDGLFSDDVGDFSIDISFESDLSNQVLGMNCQNPIMIQQSGRYSYDTTDFHNVYGGFNCDNFGVWGFSGGKDIVFEVVLAPNQRLSASAMDVSIGDSVIAIIDSCEVGAFSCLAWKDFGSVEVTNQTGIAKSYWLVVGGFHAYNTGSFNLNIELSP